MSRKPITPNSQAKVLLQSRRRCCICFGLNRDTSIRQGQIAHLDGNPLNNVEDNLAFLCFDHHDQYDSSTRQSKNFTPLEVKHFRSELQAAIQLAFGAQVQFGEVKGIVDFVPGHYIRAGEYESAELKVQRLLDGRYHVTGTALWGTHREYGPNIGDLDFIGELHGDTIEYRWPYLGEDKEYHAWLKFSEDGLTVTEENWLGIFGMNVTFTGQYDKAT
jgi:hypothetical protein